MTGWLSNSWLRISFMLVLLGGGIAFWCLEEQGTIFRSFACTVSSNHNLLCGAASACSREATATAP